MIFSIILNVYDIRSKMVHTVDQMDVRGYVRDSIKEMHFIIKKDGKSIEDILKILNKYGFSEMKPWHED